jgi:DNA-binding transcriptional ArsR family regulator
MFRRLRLVRMESSMLPVPSDQSDSNLALNEIFGTKGQVQLLRILTAEADRPLTSPEVANLTGMTPSGARKALRRLTRAGVVEKVGTGKATRYALRTEGKLAEEIVRLFELEREALDPEWLRGRPDREEAQGNGRGGSAPRAASEVSGNGSGGNGKPDGNGAHGLPRASAHQVELDPETPEFQEGLLALLEENLSLINRARDRILEKLEHRHPNNGHDDWEWRKILDTYPLPRLIHFLESESPRALRLRRSSPFAEVLSEGERARLSEFVERVH